MERAGQEQLLHRLRFHTAKSKLKQSLNRAAWTALKNIDPVDQNSPLTDSRIQIYSIQNQLFLFLAHEDLVWIEWPSVSFGGSSFDVSVSKFYLELVSYRPVTPLIHCGAVHTQENSPVHYGSSHSISKQQARMRHELVPLANGLRHISSFTYPSIELSTKHQTKCHPANSMYSVYSSSSLWP